jgi:hypothetical protein
LEAGYHLSIIEWTKETKCLGRMSFNDQEEGNRVRKNKKRGIYTNPEVEKES